ncbi:hypothetical protein AABD60_02200 [Edwardsiella piscicida]|uniref:hypothetical protein n=1 Tax=Edwardsiella piscicida TaxID=1263550 RepID=UPI00370DC6E6
MKTSHLKPGQRVVITCRYGTRPPRHGVFLRRDGRIAVFCIDEFAGMSGPDDKGITTFSLSSQNFDVKAEEKC